MDYKDKYLKYKSKYLNLKKQSGGNGLTQKQIDYIKNSVQYVYLPKGTKLYRTQSEKHNCDIEPLKCPDTGKIGMYFSNTMHIPMGMILEYKKSLNMCVYETTEDLKLYIGKYSFRNLEPKLFYKSFEDWQNKKFIFNIDPKNEEYWNHYDNTSFPIIDIFQNNYELWLKMNLTEIFITDRNKIKLVTKLGMIDQNNARKYLEDELSKIIDLENKKVNIAYRLAKIKEDIDKKKN